MAPVTLSGRQLCGSLEVSAEQVVSINPVSTRLVQTLQSQHLLCHFITRPANRGTGHSGDNSGPQTLPEPGQPLSPPNNRRSLLQPITVPNLGILTRSPRLKQRLDDIERRRGRSGNGTRKTSRDTMRQRIVLLLGVDDLDEGFVGGELERGEGDRHKERGRVGNVECTETFGFEDGLEAVADVAVRGLRELHALLDDVKGVHEGVRGGGRASSGGS